MISFHLQRTVNNWPQAIDKLPNGSLFKDVHLVQASDEAYRHNNTLRCVHRHYYDANQTYDPSSADMAICRNRADVFFRAQIDGTFRQLARSIRWVETWNETLANSQTPEEVQWRINQELAMCQIWEEQYQAEFPWMGLSLANTAVGNNIPSAYAEMAHRSNWKHAIGYHGYVAVFGGTSLDYMQKAVNAEIRPNFRDGDKWYVIPDALDSIEIAGKQYVVMQSGHLLGREVDEILAGQPVPGEWEWCSGRGLVMADSWKQLGYKNFHIIHTEGGPVRSVNGGGVLDPVGGWKHAQVCGGDPVKYVEIMRYWAQKVAQWNASNNQRCLGVTVFTTNDNSSSQWSTFETQQPEMDMLTAVSREFPPGVVVIPPTPTCEFPTETRRHMLHPSVLSRSQRQQIDNWIDNGIPAGILGQTGNPIKVGIAGWSHTDEIIMVRDALNAGKAESMLIVVDGHEIGTGLDLAWMQANCPVVANRTFFLRTFQLTHWPARLTINQRFGANPENYVQFGLPGHDGVDIAALLNDPIKAVVAGQVSEIDTVGSTPLGKFARINTLHNAIVHQFVYAHLNRVDVSIGQQITGGAVIGLAGSTGNSTGVHLHLGYKQLSRTYKTQEGVTWPSNIHDPSPLLAKLQPSLF